MRDSEERFRQLAHGRNLFVHGKERAAKRLWNRLRGKGA